MNNVHPIFQFILDTFYSRESKYGYRHDEPEPNTEGTFDEMQEGNK